MDRDDSRMLRTWMKILLPVVALLCLVVVALLLNNRPVPAGRPGGGLNTRPSATEGTTTTTKPQDTKPEETTPEQTEPDSTEETTEPTTDTDERKLIVIDAGHQSKGNSEKEPVGPGATEMKAKVTGGTRGVVTNLSEYKLNLMVAKKLQAVLESRGYRVVMTRTENDVNISNAERAKIANDLNADAFVRIHANGANDSKSNGILTICQSKKNPYNKELYEESYLLSGSILNEMVKTTGAKKLYVWENDTMSGINWCQVPVTIVEMGFMTNAVEDRNLANDDYQNKLATGIANGIDLYFSKLGGEKRVLKTAVFSTLFCLIYRYGKQSM